MRLLAITPIHVTEEELARRRERYRRLAPPGFRIDVANLPDEAAVPRRLDSEADVQASEHYVYQEAMKVSPADYDGIFLDCVLDPALEPLSRASALPVFGPLKLTLGLLQGLGWRFAGVCRNEAIAAALARRVADHGAGDALAGVRVLALDFAAVADARIWNGALQQVLGELEGQSHVQAVINGCSAVDCAASRHGRIRVIDPVAAALGALGLMAG